ncbi:hypothetical protein Tco_1266658 [Tanacetum coccineum]
MGNINETTMAEYMTRTHTDNGARVVQPKIREKVTFEIKCHIIKELRDMSFSRIVEEDSNEHVDKVLEISKMFNILSVSKTLIGAARIWIKTEPRGTITTWDILKSKFLAKYCPPSKTAKQIKEIYNFKYEVDETLYRA